MTKKKPERDIYERDAQGIIGERPEVRNKPGHHSGPRRQYGSPGTGYELFEDGSYQIAPGDQHAFDEIDAEINAMQRLVNNIVDHAQGRLVKLTARRTQWFKDICTNLYRPEDLDAARYTAGNGRITFLKDKPEEPPKQ